MERLQ
jgi:hypothetical protein